MLINLSTRTVKAIGGGSALNVILGSTIACFYRTIGYAEKGDDKAVLLID